MDVPQLAATCFWAERLPGETWVAPPLRPQGPHHWCCLRQVPLTYVTDADCIGCPHWTPRGLGQDRLE